MVQLLTMKYTKEEERLLLASNVAGIIIGVSLSLLLGYLAGFFVDLKLAAASSIGWTMLWLKIGLSASPISWAITVIVCLLLCKRKSVKQSKQRIGRMIPGTLFLPLTMAYAFLVTALAIFPLCFLLFSYLIPALTMLVGALALLPFVTLIGAILLPESPAGKSLRQFLNSSKKRRKKTSKEENI